MAAIQLAFTLRTSANCKTVHLVGSWDNYAGQLPLSRDAAAKAGSWKGTFRFQASTLQAGKRYWYYYIMDGYHVSHDPAKPFTKEPTTGRSLNILDVPKTSSSSATAAVAAPKPKIATGRGISPSRIACPKPSKPYASRKVREADYCESPVVDELASQLEKASLIGKYAAASPAGSSVSVSSVSTASSLSSVSSTSSSCRCNRYGITRKGDKVLLDCGGSRCGYSDSESDCSSDESESESEDEAPVRRSARSVAVRRH